MYRTVRYEVSSRHGAYQYFQLACSRFKNMYNVANYYIRNTMTGLKKPEGERTTNEEEVLETVMHYLELNNASMNRKTGMPKKRMRIPTADDWFLGYEQLNAVFSLSNNADYRSLQSHMAQKAIRKCTDAWKAFFAGNKECMRHPEKFRGRCRIPGYIKNEMETVCFSNQSFSVKRDNKGRYVDFAKLDGQECEGKAKFYIGDYIDTDKFEKIEVKPYHSSFVLLITYMDESVCVPEEEGMHAPEEGGGIPASTEGMGVMGIDLGVKNFATITDNLGNKPVVVKGGFIKSRNQYFNKYKAIITSRLQEGRKPGEGHAHDPKLDALSVNRGRFFRDFFYKAAHKICRLAEDRGVTGIIVGHSAGWKDKVDTGHKNNQQFVSIPFSQFIYALRVTAYKYGIQVTEQEESYTSKASFLDRDAIPAFSKEGQGTYSFSGSRVRRGMYRSRDGVLINADVNASLNIIRKACGDKAFGGGNGATYTGDIQAWGFHDFYPAERKRPFKGIA